MNPEIKKLESQRDKLTKQLEQLEHQQWKLDNKIHYYQQGERRKRAHRLITKGAAVESIFPETKELSGQDFYQLVETLSQKTEVSVLLSQFTSDHLEGE